MPQSKQETGDTSAAGAADLVVTEPAHDVPEIFIDGYKNITIHNLTIRLNLIAHYPRLDKADMEARLVGRLAMSVPAFLGLYEGFGNIIQEMEARGLISRAGGSDD